MRPSYLFFGLLFIGLMVAGSYAMLNDAVSAQGFGSDNVVQDNYSSAFNRTISVSEEISSDYDSMMNWTVDKTSFLALVPHAVSMVKNMIQLPFEVIGELVGSLSGFLGLPDWAKTFLLTAVAAFTLFAVLVWC